MCSAIYTEIINQYKMKGSNVYNCMLDASKVNFGSLFILLLKRYLPFWYSKIIIRQLFSSAGHVQPRPTRF